MKSRKAIKPEYSLNLTQDEAKLLVELIEEAVAYRSELIITEDDSPEEIKQMQEDADTASNLRNQIVAEFGSQEI